jgi:ABC-type amino acid transport substrate-binding protein
VIGIVAALLLASMPAAAQQVFRVGTEGSYTPWNRTAPTGELEGFEIDLANALCDRMGVTCQFVAQDWEGILPALHAGRFDAVMTGMSVTEERKRTLAFTRPYAVSPSAFLARRDSPLQAADTLDEAQEALRGKRVGVQIGTTSEDFLQHAFGDAIEIVTYDNNDNLQFDLVSGRLDAGFSRVLTWQDFMKS